ncbi:GNAT family acetyltransferase [Aureimonas ureilytica]|uniref:GNAT family acetyltransferase n=1 Tax=Aureimonas ureilytica TaxID=401562 RepID=A0A175RVB4_9HYPH|nr:MULTISPECIES: GNAT family N-acetyltransferase [Aureimonas]KTR06792.1 GNAT family acetyltransferase [Aureimonas ureilytica]
MMSSEIPPEEDESRLETLRLVLRLARMADAPAIARHANDRQIAEMTSRIPHPYSLGHAESFLASVDGELIFAITTRDEGEFLGLCSLQATERENTAELGYWIGRSFWGKGYATEAAQAMIDYAFRALELTTVEVRCRVINGASRRVIQKCGFGYRGTGLSTSLVAGRVASETYAMDRRTWESLKAWGGRGWC